MNPSDKDKAIGFARGWLARRPIYLDTETTGLEGEVCEIAVLDWDGVVLFDSLVRPQRAIEIPAQEAHGITNAMVADAPTFEQIWERLKKILLGRTVVVYNARFDCERLRTSATRPDGAELSIFADVALITKYDPLAKRDLTTKAETLPLWCCAMRAYATFHGERNGNGPQYKWQKLGVAFERECGGGMHAGLLNGAHRARADAEMCRLLLEAMARAQTSDEATAESVVLNGTDEVSHV